MLQLNQQKVNWSSLTSNGNYPHQEHDDMSCLIQMTSVCGFSNQAKKRQTHCETVRGRMLGLVGLLPLTMTALIWTFYFVNQLLFHQDFHYWHSCMSTVSCTRYTLTRTLTVLTVLLDEISGIQCLWNSGKTQKSLFSLDVIATLWGLFHILICQTWIKMEQIIVGAKIRFCLTLPSSCQLNWYNTELQLLLFSLKMFLFTLL